MRRSFAPLFVATMIVAASAAAPAVADPVSSCSTSKGVLVAVDFRHFGGSITRGCDASITTGYDALHAAGFTTEGTVHDGTGFVCRIDGEPTPANERCFNTPPATAYWSYWHANPGQSSWSYSTKGAQSYVPKSGSIDAWVFGGTNVGGTSGRPSFSPAQVRAGSMSGGGGGGGGRGGGGVAPHPARAKAQQQSSHHAQDRSSATHPTSAASSAASTRAGGSTANRAARATRSAVKAASTGGGSSGPTIVDAKPASAEANKPHTGSAYGVFLGIALAVLLAAGAGWTVLRRRRAEAAEH